MSLCYTYEVYGCKDAVTQAFIPISNHLCIIKKKTLLIALLAYSLHRRHQLSTLPNYYLSGNVDALPEVYCKLKNENIFSSKQKLHTTQFLF